MSASWTVVSNKSYLGSAVATYGGDHDGGVKMALSTDLCAMQTIEDLSRICGEGGEDFRAAASHGHEAD